MNPKKLEYFTEFLIEQMNHWMLFPLALAVMGFSRQAENFYARPDMLAWILCSLFPLALFWQRSRISSFTRLVPAHLFTAAFAFLIPVQNPSTGRVVCVGSAVLYVLLSFRLYLKKQTIFSSPVQLPVALMISCFSILLHRDAFQGAGNWKRYCFLPLIFSFGLFFVILFLKRYEDFLNANHSSAGYLPDTEILHSGLGLAVTYTLTVVFIMISAVYLSFFKTIGDWIKDKFLIFLRWLLQKLPKSNVIEEYPAKDIDFGFSGGLPISQGRTTFWLWTLLEYIAIAGLLLLLCVFAFKMLLRFIAYIRSRLFLSKRAVPEEEEEVWDIREKFETPKKAARRHGRRTGPLSYGERIRKLYKKKLLASRARGQMARQDGDHLHIYTAREWEQKLSANGMAALYESARYSEREMNAEDLQAMKQACQQQTDASKQ